MHAHVFVVDDDSRVRSSLKDVFVAAGYASEAFASAEQFLGEVDRGRAGCVVADFRMPGMDGLEFQQQLRSDGYSIPIILLTAFADVPMAVAAIKGGAVDVLQKPAEPKLVLDRVRDAMERDAEFRNNSSERAEIEVRMAQLTPREREVVDLIVSGKPTKAIAAALGTSRNTVDNQRTRILRKMQADSAVDLVRMVMMTRTFHTDSSRYAGPR